MVSEQAKAMLVIGHEVTPNVVLEHAVIALDVYCAVVTLHIVVQMYLSL